MGNIFFWFDEFSTLNYRDVVDAIRQLLLAEGETEVAERTHANLAITFFTNEAEDHCRNVNGSTWLVFTDTRPETKPHSGIMHYDASLLAAADEFSAIHGATIGALCGA